MGIRERRQRERQELRSRILGAAREIASAEGWPSVTIRAIAERIEYSPPVLYEYFDSKDDLFLELMRMSYAGQLAAVEAAHDASDDPEEALLGMARAWCRFAFDCPELYQVMYGLGGVSCPAPDLRQGGEKIAEVMASAITEVLQKYGKDETDIQEKVVLGWATLHGLVALAMVGRIDGGAEEVERLVDLAIRDYLAAWKAA